MWLVDAQANDESMRMDSSCWKSTTRRSMKTKRSNKWKIDLRDYSSKRQDQRRCRHSLRTEQRRWLKHVIATSKNYSIRRTSMLSKRCKRTSTERYSDSKGKNLNRKSKKLDSTRWLATSRRRMKSYKSTLIRENSKSSTIWDHLSKRKSSVCRPWSRSRLPRWTRTWLGKESLMKQIQTTAFERRARKQRHSWSIPS